MTLVWIRPSGSGGRSAADLAEHLKPFGVNLLRPMPYSCVVYRSMAENKLMKEVGELTVGRAGVSVRPRQDTTEPELRLLLGCAEKALREKPSRATGWQYKRTKQASWWRCTILRPIDDGDEEASAFRSAHDVLTAIHLHEEAEVRSVDA
jgi:hypothetical protein